MRAFVFSGGANRGALQAGAAQALVEAGIVPDMVLGSSVGSINAAALALQPPEQGVEVMRDYWGHVRCQDIFPGNTFSMLLRMIQQRGSLHDERAFYRFLGRVFGSTKRRFKDLRIPLFVTATRFDTGGLHLFGSDPDERLIDAVMASCAVPPYLPPYHYRGQIFLDGGFVSNLPISAAIAQGATEIWALEIGVDEQIGLPGIGMIKALSRSVEALLRLQMAREIELVRMMQQNHVTIHHIQMLHYCNLDVRDFRWNSKLMQLGYDSAALYINERRQLAVQRTPPQLSRRSVVQQAVQHTIVRHVQKLQQNAATVRSRWPVTKADLRKNKFLAMLSSQQQ